MTAMCYIKTWTDFLCGNPDGTWTLSARKCMRRSRGGGGGGTGTPLKNHKNIGFLSNTGPDPFENHKATKPAFNVGSSLAHQRNAI